MEKNELKVKIENSNKAYRTGTALISDYEYDSLLEQYSKLCDKNEFELFQNTLHEISGKVKHPFVMGSLNKLKAEEPQYVYEFIKKHVHNTLNASAKVDGLSCRLHYENGKLMSASTRGDGSFGESITDKALHLNNVPQTIRINDSIDIRGELVILKKDFAHFETEFANPRNAVAGLINRKEWKKDDISKVSFIAYTVLGSKYSKKEQFSLISSLGFTTAWNKNIDKDEYSDSNFIEKLVEYTKQNFDYENDGLVISDSEYHNEEAYRPENQVAFKINQMTAITTILDVEFDGPSGFGVHCPVAILDPVELGGAMISRATLHNLDYIKEMNLKYGSKIEILRSGDVIPKIIKVVENPSNTSEINLPLVCNCCGEKLIRDGVHLRCANHNCKDQIMHRLASFIVKLGIKGATEKTLENLGIDSYDKLLNFSPNKSYKTQIKLYDELMTKMFTRSKQSLLAALPIQDVGETLINKIIDHYGLANVENNDYSGSLPSGIGEITLQKFKDAIQDNISITTKIINDSRYNYSATAVNSTGRSKNNMSICFTGKLNTMGRTEAEKKAMEHGFEIKSVSKNLTYLVTNDPNTNSGKGKKARELGIKIISENEFLKMISDEQDSSLENL